VIFKKLMDALANAKANKDIDHGLRLVREGWLVYKASRPLPDEQDIVQFAAPFVAPMLAQLASDSRWGNKSIAERLDLVFVVLLADAETELGRAKLQATREHLLAGAQ
jgi:hypothetical protein